MLREGNPIGSADIPDAIEAGKQPASKDLCPPWLLE
jgi:hypothetical protein